MTSHNLYPLFSQGYLTILVITNPIVYLYNGSSGFLTIREASARLPKKNKYFRWFKRAGLLCASYRNSR